jgi:hypothetical protein
MHAGMVRTISPTPVNQAIVSRRERICVNVSHIVLELCQKSITNLTERKDGWESGLILWLSEGPEI